MSQLATEHKALNLSQGIPELRQAIATKVSNLYGATVDVDQEITVTSGATDALFTAITTIVNAGDEVIVFDPAYDCYEPAIDLAGGKTILDIKGVDLGLSTSDIVSIVRAGRERNYGF